eukprot:CAMPEP_0198591568 /NCGR_PEP_ID=MMETSP1462-20131121/137075_1 /TAXON_ID=1333877 /ORGANISM="Brandtodinium nutriculum, Strain RCC3387" /LENGTH=93 /DNA_ID=CAMNT_0044323133 /DNA_START=8 /DNA_END=286 /DNA_ORIENTATION=-
MCRASADSANLEVFGTVALILRDIVSSRAEMLVAPLPVKARLISALALSTWLESSTSTLNTKNVVSSAHVGGSGPSARAIGYGLTARGSSTGK